MDRAGALLDARAQLTARDALHAAVYFDVSADAIVSYDEDFDSLPGVRRLPPDRVP